MLVPVPLLVRRVMSTKESDLPGGECRGGAAAARGGGCLAEGSAAPALFNVDLQHQPTASRAASVRAPEVLDDMLKSDVA